MQSKESREFNCNNNDNDSNIDYKEMFVRGGPGLKNSSP